MPSPTGMPSAQTWGNETVNANHRFPVRRPRDSEMHFLPVKSTSLAAIAYESPRQRLHIHFQDRSVYTYFDVPAHVYQQLLEAPSKGLYFNAWIRGKFI